MNAAAGRFAYQYDIFNSCNDSLFAQGGAWGTFEVHGVELSFAADIGGGRVATFGGHVANDSVFVADDALAYAFVR